MSTPRLATRLSLLLLLGALILTACVTALADDDGRKVVGGYFEEWSIYFANFNIANLQANGVADRLTHLNYAFGGVNSTGCFIADSWADYQTPYLPDHHRAIHRAALRQLRRTSATQATASQLESADLAARCGRLFRGC